MLVAVVRGERIVVSLVARDDLPPLGRQLAEQSIVEVLASQVIAQHHVHGMPAPDRVGADGIDRDRVRTEAGKPLKQAGVERLLGRQVAVVVVGRMQGDRPAHRLEVVAPSSRSTTVDDQIGLPLAKRVPVSQVALHVEVLGDALAVGRIVLAPERERIHVEVLAIEIDALFAEHAIHVIGEPASSVVSPRFRSVPPRSHSGCFSASQVPWATRSGSNQTSVFTPRLRAWSLIARSPCGNRSRSGSHVPVLGHWPPQGYQPASIHQYVMGTRSSR